MELIQAYYRLYAVNLGFVFLNISIPKRKRLLEFILSSLFLILAKKNKI